MLFLKSNLFFFFFKYLSFSLFQYCSFDSSLAFSLCPRHFSTKDFTSLFSLFQKCQKRSFPSDTKGSEEQRLLMNTLTMDEKQKVPKIKL